MNISTSMSMGSTATAASALATSSMAMSMSMDMGDSARNACKISMLWNWYTVDACFISRSWQVTSRGMFAGSCIGVIVLVMALEFLRRASREYDGYIIREAVPKRMPKGGPVAAEISQSSVSIYKADETRTTSQTVSVRGNQIFRPSVVQQVIRATLHMLQFGVAYFIMLLAMYYNGYIIICIILGAFFGAFVFSWEGMSLESNDKKEATICCG